MVVNGTLAVAAVVGLRHARQDARRAEQRADTAQRELAEDRAQREGARRAQADLENVRTILVLHEAASPNVVLSSLEVGRLRAALAALPPGSIPRTRALYADPRDSPPPSRHAVTDELHAAVQELRESSTAT